MDHADSMSHAICPRGTVFADAVASVRDGATDAAGAAPGLVGQMSDDELLWVLDGDYTALRGLRAMFDWRTREIVPLHMGRSSGSACPGSASPTGRGGGAGGALDVLPGRARPRGVVRPSPRARPRQRWDVDRFVLDHGEAVIEVGAWSGDPEAVLRSVRLDGSGV